MEHRCEGEWRNGRRAGFRCQCPQGRGGSTPLSPTIKNPTYFGGFFDCLHNVEESDTKGGRAKRKQIRENQKSVELLFPLTDLVDVDHFIADLTENGYVPISCKWQSRLNDDGSHYPAVRAMFVHCTALRPNQRVLPVASTLRQLRPLTDGAYWRTRAYVNAMLDAGSQELQVGCSFNFEHREPRYDRNGELLLRRLNPKNRDEKPVPIQPAATLRLIKQTFQLI